MLPLRVHGQAGTFAGNAQHTAIYSAPAQHLNAIHWSTSIDTSNTGAEGHYGAPLITAANTVLVPVRTAGGYRIDAFDGATGRHKYTLNTDFIMPPIATNGWIPVYQPALANPVSGQRLYFPGAGGTVFFVDNVDSDTPGAPIRQCFYTNLTGYAANSNAYNSSIFINTPITPNTNGVIFFGFRAQNTIPAPLNTTNGGFVRLDASGSATYTLAGTAANDSRIYRDSHNSAPALSNDGATLYVVVKGPNANFAYLLALDSTTLALKHRVQLLDPRNGQLAGVLDDSTASPLVGPDDDVYFGVFANPNNGSRGFLLHFSADLQTKKAPSAFGWDNTPAIVPASMVPSYTGPSSYLLFSKYNDYAGGEGSGINRHALLDPNQTQLDPHPTAVGLVEMREVLTVIGVTPDAEYMGTNYPYAVREWCINTAAVNPATKSVFTPSEDGHVYRWDLAANCLTESATLSPGIGEPYVPTVLGPDGTIYTLNGGTMFALGGLTNVAVGVYSSVPDMRTVVAGQPITFTAVVTNVDPLGTLPTGTVTFTDKTYRTLTPVTTNFATNVPLTNGMATVTTSSLTAGSNYLGNHFITVTYSGNGTFSPGSATMVQKVHAYGSTLNLITSGNSSNNGVTITAAVSTSPPSASIPSGMVSFWDGSTFLGQVAQVTNGYGIFGYATLTLTNLPPGSHANNATYVSDTLFAASSGAVQGTSPAVSIYRYPSNAVVQLNFSNVVGAPFTVLASPNVALPSSNWTALGSATELTPGRYQFTDSSAPANQSHYYRVRSP